MKTAQELIDIIRTTDETSNVEAKECVHKVDRSVMETICAFANEPGLGGGYIVLGIRADHSKLGDERYKVIGVHDPDKIQNDIVSQCANVFNRRPTVRTNPETIEGKTVVVIKVSENEPESKPIYFSNEGLPRGAYRRIGGSDQRCTEDDMSVFYAKPDDFEKSIVEDTTLDDVDENALRQYRRLRREVNSHAEELSYDDHDLLLSLGCIRKDKDGEWRLTYAGLIVFGKSMVLRRILPMVKVDYIRVPGTEWVPSPDERFDTIDMRGPFILLVNRIYNAIVDDLPRRFALKEGDIQSSSSTIFPEKSLREAIVNALIHQTFRVHRPLQVIRYSNRIEIINPGYSLKPEESLGEPGSVLRNPLISLIFHETDLAETKGSGLKSMRLSMTNAGLIPPTYESDHDKNIFTLRLLIHHLFSDENMTWLKGFDGYDLTQAQRTALVFLREVGAIDVSSYRQLTGVSTPTAKSELSSLASLNIIEAKGHGRKTYYIPTPLTESKFISGADIDKYGNPDGLCGNPDGLCGNPDGLCGNPDSLCGNPDGLCGNPDSLCGNPDFLCGNPNDWIPEDLRIRLAGLKKRVCKKEIFNIVQELCRLKPLSVTEIALILGRTERHVRERVVTPMKKAAMLAFTHPEMVNHPDQRYKAGSKASM